MMLLAAISLLVVLACLLNSRIKPAWVFLAAAFGFHFLGVVDLADLRQAFSNPALLTLVLLILVSLAFERSRLVESLSTRLVGQGGRGATFRVSVVAALLSTFMSNTAVVAALMSRLNRGNGEGGRLLMPLSFAAVLGGTVTLVGTSTNLIANSLVIKAGLPPLGMFDFAWVGIPLCFAGIAALLVMHRWLPAGQIRASHGRAYLLEARVLPGSPLCGRSVAENGLRNMDGIYLAELLRDGRLITPVTPAEVLQGDDILLFSGQVDRVHSLTHYPGLQVSAHGSHELGRNLVEVALTGQSVLINRSLREVDFRALFDAAVIGIRRGGEALSGQLGRIQLQAGDALMLAVGQDFYQHHNLERNFYLLRGEPFRPPLRRWQSVLCLLGFASVIVLASLHVVSLATGLLGLLVLMMALGILRSSELRRRFPWEIYLLVAGALAYATALEHSGLLAWVSEHLLQLLGDSGNFAALAGLFVATIILTQVVNHAATVALMLPLAISLATSLGASVEPFVMAVTIATSGTFILPYGYQTNLMVMSAAGYKVRDFILIGTPFTILYTLVSLAVIPWAFPF